MLPNQNPERLSAQTPNALTTNRSHLRRSTKRSILASAAKRANELLEERGARPLPRGLTPHKLRHTFASILVATGEDPASVMAQLGHTDPKFTVFAGSQPSLMHALFSEHERPFYSEARPLELPALPIAEAARDIEALFVADGLHPAGAVDGLLAYTAGHPQRTMLLAHHLYNLLEEQPDHPDPAPAALELALVETRDSHQAVWDGLNRNERLVLLALGDGQAPTGSVFADEHRVARSTLQEALARLLADERQIRRDADGKPYLLDPLFAEWLRRR